MESTHRYNFLKISLFAVIVLSLFSTLSCKPVKTTDKPTIIVSIPPLKYLVDKITEGNMNVEILLPEGVSPESFSPTPSQISNTDKAEIIFTTGLIDFEVGLIEKLNNSLKNSKIIPTSKGITLIKGACSHSHENTRHSHGIDPHIWTSPEQLKVIITNIYDALVERYPESAEKYHISYNSALQQLNDASRIIKEKINNSDNNYFIVYHPALTYYAHDYGIEQIALESDGKEPSAVYLMNITSKARQDKIKYVLYQKQFSDSTVRTFAKDIGATPVQFNPLAEDIIAEILYVTSIITK